MDNSKLPQAVGQGKVEAQPGGVNIPGREIVTRALSEFFLLLGTEIDGLTDKCPLFSDAENGMRLLVVLSDDQEALKDYFEQLILAAYSDEKVEFANQRYLFVETGGAPDRLFDVLSLIFENLGIGKCVKVWDLFPALELLNKKDKHIGRLRDKIEEMCFASGVEEMKEFLSRDQRMLHDVFNYIQDKKKSAARLIIGAYLAGEVSYKIMIQILIELIKQPGDISKIEECFQKFHSDYSRLKEEVDAKFKNPLWKYAERKKILLIEDQIGSGGDGWDTVLPAIFLSEDRYRAVKSGKNLYQMFSALVNGTGLSLELKHCKTIDEALGRDDSEEENFNLKEFDIILLDLYSSDSHPGITLPVNAKSPMRQLFEKFDNFYKEQIIPEPIPQVIIFSQDSTGITARTMFNEFKIADYFFKNSEHETHKSGYYSSFRNAIITALKENALHVSALTAREGRRKFDRWLRQFEPCDRPVILHLMKHFKYFSSPTIVELFNIYFGKKMKTKWRKKDGKVSILGSRYRNPNRFFFSYLGRPNKSGPATVPLLSKTGWFQNLRKKIDDYSKLPRRKNYPRFLSYDDLQQELIADILVKDENEDHVCLVFVDDFVGSGGQIDEYIPKFINQHLKKMCRSIFNKSLKKEDIWLRLAQAFKRKKGRNALEIHIVFAIGLENEDVRKIVKNIEPVGSSEYQNIRSVKGKFSFTQEGKTMNGEDGEEEKELEDIPFKVTVHIANFTQNVEEILGNNDALEKIKEVLLKYSVITTMLRSEDYVCEFEPIGWKDNGGLTATYANSQGNTLPVIWRDFSKEDILKAEGYHPLINRWESLYTRYFNPLTSHKEEKKDKKARSKKEELPCYNNRACELNSSNWNKDFIDEHWKNHEDPPCKLK